jgi:hypothetical protein
MFEKLDDVDEVLLAGHSIKLVVLGPPPTKKGKRPKDSPPDSVGDDTIRRRPPMPARERKQRR